MTSSKKSFIQSNEFKQLLRTLQSNKKFTADPLLQIKSYQIHNQQPSNFIQMLSFMLIRPPRILYNINLLIPQGNSARFTFQNYQIQSQLGKVLFQLSLYKQQKMDYVILYLHGNASNRLETVQILDKFPTNVGVACFDFKGCGNRLEGKYITLGKEQSKQVDIAAKFLKNLGYKVIGWGRSMGAVSLLLSNQVQIMIVDSPYCSLKRLCSQSQKKVLPCILSCFSCCFYSYFFQKIKQKVFQLAQLNIQQMQITQKIKQKQNNKLKICFMHGEQDTLINYQHSVQLYQNFKGRKQYILFEGSHNDQRNDQVYSACIQFIQQSISMQKYKQVQKNIQLFFEKKQGKKQKFKKIKMEQINSLKKNKNKIKHYDQKIKDSQYVINNDLILSFNVQQMNSIKNQQNKNKLVQDKVKK